MSGHEVNLLLYQTQIGQLLDLCTRYRSYAWSSLAPTPERNQTMRGVQTVQGRLLAERTTSGGEEVLALALPISDEEREALQNMLSTLASVDPRAWTPEDRVWVPNVVAELRLLLTRATRKQEPSWGR